jgi:hypothetical protein
METAENEIHRKVSQNRGTFFKIIKLFSKFQRAVDKTLKKKYTTLVKAKASLGYILEVSLPSFFEIIL